MDLKQTPVPVAINSAFHKFYLMNVLYFNNIASPKAEIISMRGFIAFTLRCVSFVEMKK